MDRKEEGGPAPSGERVQDTARIDLVYPRHNPIKQILVSLVDIRAADDILIQYDFNRDGWVIKQASTFEWPGDDEVCDPDWQEVAFIQAWAREKKPQGEAPEPKAEGPTAQPSPLTWSREKPKVEDDPWQDWKEIALDLYRRVQRLEEKVLRADPTPPEGGSQ